MTQTTILIVDDDPEMNERLAGIVRTVAGVEPDLAFNATEAKRLIDKNTYSVAFMDIDLGPDPIHLTRYSGLKFLSTLAAKGTVAIVISGVGDKNLHDVAITFDAFEFLSKPLENTEIVHTLRMALSSSENRTEIGDVPRWPKDIEPNPKLNPGLLYKGKEVRLTMIQTRLVNRLLKASGEVVSIDDLAKDLNPGSDKGAVATHMSNIRKVFMDIDKSFASIKNRMSLGYYWKF